MRRAVVIDLAQGKPVEKACARDQTDNWKAVVDIAITHIDALRLFLE